MFARRPWNDPDLTRPVLRSILACSITLALALAVAPAQAAPVGVEARGGWYSNGLDDFFLGAGVRFSLGTVSLIPNGEWLFVDNGSTYTLNVDATLTVLPLGAASGYIGAGAAFVTTDPDNGESDTRTGANAIAGVGLNALPLKPFAQVKYVFVEDENPFAIMLGVRF